MKRIVFIAILIIAFVGRFNYLVFAKPPINNYIQLLGGYLKASSSHQASPQGFSFEAWVRPENVSGIRHILSIGDRASNSLHYEIGINGGSFSLRYRYGQGSLRLITAGNIEEDTWSHLAVVISSSYTRLFIDGSQIFEAPGANQLLPIGKDMVIGNSYLEPVFSSEVFRGDFDEIRVSSKARDVASLWASGVYDDLLSSDNGTVVLWHLDESRGQSQANDSSGSNFYAVLIGGDAKIHFFGVIPTPTPIVLPTIRWNMPVLPTLSIPDRFRPTPRIVQPPSKDEDGDSPIPSSSPINIRDRFNIRRPVFPRR